MAGAGKVAKSAVSNPKLLEYLVCPLSKTPLRYCEQSQELINDELGVAYPVVDGIPCLVPADGRILDTGDNSHKSEPRQDAGYSPME
ncbi:hypothetical protein O6H91_11G053300 [Diphasiastrum complanatum]|uniref:Uncharacterized protein n=1 Tax=Diphasiastrum complanatum TaxID=34168 RepID=A0ACC2C9H3_DIPCM|nr:hypothetical protein O6H91_11G053300 [Diphasiastrum complanatum]